MHAATATDITTGTTRQQDEEFIPWSTPLEIALWEAREVSKPEYGGPFCLASVPNSARNSSRV
jgi:hypothetical protein